jgi:hypothetical protein
MNELAIPKVDTYMSDWNTTFFIGEEKEQVTFFKMGFVYRNALFRL